MREWLHSMRLRWRMLCKRRQLDRDLEEELAFHREMRAAKYREAGEQRDEARQHAARRFGNVTFAQETLRDTWSFVWLEGFWRDLQHAARALRRSPGVSIVAIVTLALGIGANTSVFTVMNAMFLRSLPVRDPQALRVLNWAVKGDAPKNSMSGYAVIENGLETGGSFSYPMFTNLRKSASGYASLAGFVNIGTNAAARGQAYAVWGALVTPNYFETVGTAPALGRTFRPEEDSASAPQLVVISHRLWERMFGADASALGATLEIERAPFTVIGILPPSFTGLRAGETRDVYLPLARAGKFFRWASFSETDNWWVQAIARVRPDGGEQRLRAAVNVMLARQAAEFNADPKTKRKAGVPWSVLVDGRAGLAFLGRRMSNFLTALMGMVVLVLLIACANVASILVARGTARTRELAIRQSLGAGSWRIMRHLLLEALLLALAGGLLGLLLAQGGTRVLANLMAEADDSMADLRPDAAVLAFTLGLSLATALLFGAAPAVRALRVRADSWLRQAGSTSGGLKQRFAHVLVVVQVALATVLVAGAGLFARTLVNLDRVNLGFNPDRMLLFRVDSSRNGYKPQQAIDVYRRIRDKVGGIPGVKGVTLSRSVLLSGSMSNNAISVPGYTPRPGENMSAHTNAVGERFATVMGIRLLAGRDLDASDSEQAPPVALVNQALANRFYHGNALDRELKRNDRWLRIVGVVADAKYNAIRQPAPPTLYYPFVQQQRQDDMAFEVRTAQEPLSIVSAIRRAVAEVDPTLPVADVRTQRQQIDRAISRERTFALLASFFSVVALVLSAIGLYGTLAYAVARRTSEFGVRMALGATGPQIRWLALRGSIAVMLAGVGAGIPVALALAKLVKSNLYNVEPADPVSMVLAVAAMLAAGAAGAWIPGRRAAKCDPLTALRYE